jgi:ATP-dependent Clp protease ATP-binding subunit ClpA
MILEPSTELAKVFDRSIEIALENEHEYLTLEHLALSIFTNEDFLSFITDYPCELDYIRSNIEHYIANQLTDIKTTKKGNPQKTQTVERCLNRAFTQVLLDRKSVV